MTDVAHFFNSCVRSLAKFDTGPSEMTLPEEKDWVTKTGVKKSQSRVGGHLI